MEDPLFVAKDALVSAAEKPDPKTMYRQLVGALNEPISTERWMALARVLEGLSADNWKSAFQVLDDERRVHGKDHPEARAFLIRRAGEVVGLAAIDYLIELKDRGGIASALTGWASKEPVGALEWLAKQGESQRSHLAGHAIRGLSLAEPDLAIAYLEQTPLAERHKYTPSLIATIERTAGIEQTQRLVEGMIDRARSSGTLGQRYLTDSFRDLAEIKVRRAHVSGNIETGMGWIDQHVGQPYMGYEAVRNAAGQLAQSDPMKALEWIGSVNTRASFPKEISPVGYGTVLNAWVEKAGYAPVGQWLQSNVNHAAYDRMASYYAELTVDRNPQLGIPVASAIKDPAARAAALEKLQRAAAKRTGAK